MEKTLSTRKLLYIALSIVLILASAVPLAKLSEKTYQNAFPSSMPQMPVNKEFAQVILNQPNRNTQHMYFMVKQNMGIINWYGAILMDENAVAKYTVNPISINDGIFYNFFKNPTYKDEVYFNKKGNKIFYADFSANRIIVGSQVNEPDTLVVNQNFHHSWKTNTGKISPYKGLLSVHLTTPGIYRITLTYKPMSVYIGMVVSIISLAALLLFHIKGIICCYAQKPVH